MNVSVARISVAVLMTLAFAACSASKPAADGKTKEEIRAEKIAAKEEAQAKKYPPPPADSLLAKIERGMSEAQVREILGPPTTQQSYQSGKQWIPGYGAFAPDTHRTEFVYKGLGVVTFNQNKYTGKLAVVRAVHDPNR
ncbi:MAG: outer membrane protein assembly factor BamE [Candidatus Binatia bacterium]